MSKNSLRLFDHAFAEQRAADLEHQVDVVLITELEHTAEALHGRVGATELEQRLTETGERVLVLGIEDQRLLEAAASPRELVAGEPSVTNPNVQLYRVRIERESLPKYVERLDRTALRCTADGRARRTLRNSGMGSAYLG